MGAEQRQCPRGFFNRSALLSRSRHVLQCNARRLVRQAEEEESSDWSREVNKIRSRRHTTIRNNPGRKVDTLFPFRYFIIVHFWISPIILFIYLQLGFLSTTGHLRAFTHKFSGLDDILWIGWHSLDCPGSGRVGNAENFCKRADLTFLSTRSGIAEEQWRVLVHAAFHMNWAQIKPSLLHLIVLVVFLLTVDISRLSLSMVSACRRWPQLFSWN